MWEHVLADRLRMNQRIYRCIVLTGVFIHGFVIIFLT